MPEDTTNVTTVIASDADSGQTLTYSISGPDAAKFNLNPSTGVLTFLTAPNFEAPSDVGGNNIYDFVLQVSDGFGGVDTQSVALTVTDVANESLSATVDGGGNLTLADIDGTGKNNQVSISTDGLLLTIADINEKIFTAPGGWTLSSDNRSISRPLAGFTGSITVNGNGGNDTFTLNFAGGDILPNGGVTFNGGNPTCSPGDALVLVSGSQGTVTYNYTNANSGSIVLSNYGTVNYTGLEPITNTGAATDIVFNLPATLSNAFLEDDGTASNALSRLRSGNSSFETTTFANSPLKKGTGMLCRKPRIHCS